MHRLLARLLFFVLATASLIQGQTRTFTDAFGRTIEAEILAVEGDNVRIRRTDGSVFTVPSATFSEEDRKAIAAWVAQQPKEEAKKEEEKFVLDPKQLIVGLSRGKFSSTTLAKFEGYTHKHEMWGYTIQLTNKHLRSVEKIRVEYNLFARTYSDISTPSVITGRKEFDVITSGDSAIFRTGGTEVCKRRDIYFGNNGGEMRGIWMRIYADGALLIEQSSPDSLMNTETWRDVGKDRTSTGQHIYY